MSLVENIKSIMLNDETIFCLVGNRIYRTVRRKGSTLPAIVLTVANDIPGYTNNGPTAIPNATVEVDCWAKTPEEAEELKNAVKDLLDGYDGIAGEGTINGVFTTDDQEFYEKDSGNSRVFLEFSIWYKDCIIPQDYRNLTMKVVGREELIIETPGQVINPRHDPNAVLVQVVNTNQWKPVVSGLSGSFISAITSPIRGHVVLGRVSLMHAVYDSASDLYLDALKPHTKVTIIKYGLK